MPNTIRVFITGHVPYQQNRIPSRVTTFVSKIALFYMNSDLWTLYKDNVSSKRSRNTNGSKRTKVTGRETLRLNPTCPFPMTQVLIISQGDPIRSNTRKITRHSPRRAESRLRKQSRVKGRKSMQCAVVGGGELS